MNPASINITLSHTKFHSRQKKKVGMDYCCTSNAICKLAVTALAPATAVVSTWIIHCVFAGKVMYPVGDGVFQLVPVVV
jgi:hypothetical protein